MQNDLLLSDALTVRIGCAFTYEAPAPVALVLNVKPRRDPWQALQEETLKLGSNLPAEEFDDAHGTWPRGDRPAALREAAHAFRDRFKAQGRVRAVRTIDLVSAGYPVDLAFHGAARAVNPFVNILNRLVVVQFEGFDAPQELARLIQR